MSDHCADPISEKIKNLGRGKNIGVSYSETKTSMLSYKMHNTWLYISDSKYRKYQKTTNKIIKDTIKNLGL